MSNSWKLALASIAVTATVAACGTPGGAGDSGDSATAGGEGPVKVGLVYSKSGPLATYGAQYKAAFDVGLDYAVASTPCRTTVPSSHCWPSAA